MIEKKFKVWDTKRKRMYYLLENGWIFGTCEEDRAVSWEDVFAEKNTGLIAIQYTGLKDKNGVDIYEGDIIAKEYKNGLVTDSEPSEVNMGYLYDSDGYCSGGYLCWRVGEYDSLTDICKFAEVKGNIYENPELLEGLR